MSNIVSGWVVVDLYESSVLAKNWTRKDINTNGVYFDCWAPAHHGYIDEFGQEERLWFTEGAYLFQLWSEADNARRRLRSFYIKENWVEKGDSKFSIVRVDLDLPKHPTYISRSYVKGVGY